MIGVKKKKRISFVICFFILTLVTAVAVYKWGRLKTVTARPGASTIRSVGNIRENTDPKEELAVKNVFVREKFIPSVNPPDFTFDIHIIRDWAFGDIIEKDKKSAAVAIRTVLLRKIGGEWKLSPRKDPLEFAWEKEMPADIRKYYQQWDSGHF